MGAWVLAKVEEVGVRGMEKTELFQECVNSGPPGGLGFGQSRRSGCQGYGKDRVISRRCKFWSSKGLELGHSKLPETDRDRQRQTETDRERQTDRDRQRQTGRH